MFCFLLPVQDLGKDSIFIEIWQKSLKFSSFSCICLRKQHFACEKALIIWNLLFLWSKIKTSLKFLCVSRLWSPDWAQPICWALCKWHKLEARAGLRIPNFQVLRALPCKLSGDRQAELTGNGADFPCASAKMRLPTIPWALTESVKSRNNTRSRWKFSCC